MDTVDKYTDSTCTQITVGNYPHTESGEFIHGTVMIGYKADPDSSIQHFVKVTKIEKEEIIQNNKIVSSETFYVVDINGKEERISFNKPVVLLNIEKKKEGETNGSY